MKLTLSSLPIKSTVIAALIVAFFSGGYFYREFGPTAKASPTTITNPPILSQSKSAAPLLPNFADIASQQGPAVVNISVSGTIKTGMSNFPQFPQMDPDDPFFDFFRRFQPDIPEGNTPVQAMGSGFIVKSNGIILTNAHVVADAKEVTVKLTDKREFKAKVIGMDKTSDVAVLKIDARNLPTAKIGNPGSARVGDWVVAIGAPFGFENSVTAGIISAKSRSLPDEGYVSFLQTDVPINPGNSGGPLFNLNGEVIGINSQIYSRSGGYQGLSFAIPIDVAEKVEQQLLEHGKVSRGRLGVLIQPVTQELAESFGLDKPVGALVSEVEKGGAAEKAGIEAGDVILKFNNNSIERSEDLPPMVADTTPGATVKIEIWHNKETKVISAHIGEIKSAKASVESTQSSKVKLGLEVRPLTDEERKEADVSGLIVENVSDGPAAQAGIRPGDVILTVNGAKVESVGQLRSLIEKSQGRLALLIKRGDSRMFVPIKIG